MILSRETLVNNITSELADNSTGEISPADIRHNMLDLIDSVHILLSGQSIHTNNFATPELLSTKVGALALDKYNLNGYSTSGNTAVGYAALENNYTAGRNSALGAFALNCNVHGSGNSALGYHSLAGNTTGFGNVGVGPYALNYNKLGNFNIAIGHGAGYYADRTTSYKLFIAAHGVDDTYICDNRPGSGLVPLMYGDLSGIKLGIGTRGLHGDGVLQTSGDITAASTNLFDLGTNNYYWKKTHSKELSLSSTLGIKENTSGILTSGNLIPAATNTYNLGASGLKWDTAHIRSLYAGYISALEMSHYKSSRIFLASSGTFNGIDGGGVSGIYDYFSLNPESGQAFAYLPPSAVLNAGLTIKTTSGDYNWVFDTSPEICGDTYTRWKSNIGIELENNQYIKALGMVANNSCNGFFANSGQLFGATKSIYDNRGTVAGLGEVNFISDNGDHITDYTTSMIAAKSGVNVAQRFILRGNNKVQTGGQDNLTGFSLTAFDASGITSTANLDRFVISSYDNSPNPTNHVMVMKNTVTSSGVFGVNNFGTDGGLIVPNTILNVRSKESAIARITAENDGDDIYSSLQLLTNTNCESDGGELRFKNSSKSLNINVYKNSGVFEFMCMSGIPSHATNASGQIGLMTSGNTNEMLTLGCSGHPNAAFSIYRSKQQPTSTGEFYSSIYVSGITDSGINLDANDQFSVDNRSDTLMFIDNSGNKFDLVENICDYTTASTYYDTRRNIAIGQHAIQKRCNLTTDTGNSNTASGNTAIGHSALKHLSSGHCNTVVGHHAGSLLNSGQFNIGIGYRAFSASQLDDGNGSVSNSGASYNIVIGNEVGDVSTDYNFIVGAKSGTLLMSGVLGPTNDNKHLYMPEGNLTLQDQNLELKLNAASIEVIDTSGTLPTDSLNFRFSGSGTHAGDAMVINHAASPMSVTTNYQVASSGRPFAEVKGDLRVMAALRFSDGTSMTTSPDADIAAISGAVAGINDMFAEGFANQDIDYAGSYNNPTIGTMTNGGSTYTLFNRDKHSKITTGDYVIALKMGDEYRPIWISNHESVCTCCGK